VNWLHILPTGWDSLSSFQELLEACPNRLLLTLPQAGADQHHGYALYFFTTRAVKVLEG
jgi:hypothetical protein